MLCKHLLFPLSYFLFYISSSSFIQSLPGHLCCLLVMPVGELSTLSSHKLEIKQFSSTVFWLLAMLSNCACTLLVGILCICMLLRIHVNSRLSGHHTLCKRLLICCCANFVEYVLPFMNLLISTIVQL